MSSPDKSQIDIVRTISAEKKRHLKINDKYQSTISLKRYLIAQGVTHSFLCYMIPILSSLKALDSLRLLS